MSGKLVAVLCAFAVSFLPVAVIIAAPTVYPDGVTIHEAGVAEGYVLFAGQDGQAHLLDVDGTDVQTWSSPCGGDLHHGPQRPLANGNILIKTCGNVAELDWGGAVVWQFAPPPGVLFHHDWERLPNGNTMILCRQNQDIPVPSISDKNVRDDFILEVSPAGDIVWEWHAVDHFDEFGFSQERKDLIFESGGNWSHANTVARIPDNSPHNDPRFLPGNIILSLRHQNTIAIIDRVTSQVVWVSTDDVVGPHTTHMIPGDQPGGGNILVFDNGYAQEWSVIPNRYYSRVLEIDPLDGSVPYNYDATSSGFRLWTFFSPATSGAQRLSNGNTLITEGRFGRIFEVTDSGQIVWEYVVPYRSASNSNDIYRAYKVPLDWPGPNFACPDGSCDPGENECSCAADCGTPPASEVGLCTDNQDNDCDLLTDCNDVPDCGGDPACACGSSGASCSFNSDCCSNKCRNGSCRGN